MTHFGFSKKPFSSSLKPADLLITSQMKEWQARCDFVATHRLWAVLTGEVGAGKSTAIRWALDLLPHPEFRPLLVTASGGSVLEIYRRILAALTLPQPGVRAKMFAAIAQACRDTASQNVTPVLVIDEASLLSLEVFRELHTLTQFDCDSKSILSVILVGQEDLIDKLSYPTSKPLASRIVARMHFVGGAEQDTNDYVMHHLHLAGVKPTLFEPASITALHQASGGILRHINNLARNAMISAAAKKQKIVTADDVRIATSELFLKT